MVLHFVDHMSPARRGNTTKPVAIVAGVGPGIGTSVALAFGAEGFAIALLARDSARLSKRHAEITAAGITAAPFIVDLADAAATLNAVEQVRIWAGGDPSLLVYNAFALQQGSADRLDLAESQRAMRVNFIAATQLTALVAPAMRASGTGSLLFTGGGAALHPYAGLSSLCAGKAALRMWVLTLAKDLAGTGVRVGIVTVHGPVERGSAFDPDDIAAAVLRLHRGTNEGVEIHFTDGAPASGRPKRTASSNADPTLQAALNGPQADGQLLHKIDSTFMKPADLTPPK